MTIWESTRELLSRCAIDNDFIGATRAGAGMANSCVGGESRNEKILQGTGRLESPCLASFMHELHQQQLSCRSPFSHPKLLSIIAVSSQLVKEVVPGCHE